MKNRALSLLLALTMFVSMVPMLGMTALAADNPYPTWQTVGGVGTIPCTRYAWQQAYDHLGIALPAWGNAINWYYSAPSSGYSTGTTPRANSIAVWTIDSHSYGHVAFVTAVNGDRMTVNEGGRTDATASSGIVNGQDLPSGVGSTWYGRTLVGFVYLDGYSEKPITYTEIPRDVYYIRNASNNECLSVSGGVDAQGQDVVVWEYNEHPASQIEIIPASSGYKLRSGCSATRVVNANGHSVAPGQSVNLWDDVNDGTQWWGFEKVSSDKYIIRNMQNQNCVLAVSSDGRYVVVESYTGNSNQIWTITPKECKHSVYTGKMTKEPTCTATGTMTYTCTGCGHSYTETLSAYGHNHANVTVHNPTCESQGYTVYSCPCGGDSYASDYVSALGHTYTNDCDASCNRCGAERTTNHTYTNANDASCNVCGAIRQTTQPTTPSAKPTAPVVSATTPTTPTTRPTTPLANPTTPVARPTTPSAQPAVPTTQPTVPAVRPTENTATQPTASTQSVPVATAPTEGTPVDPIAPTESTPVDPTTPTESVPADSTVPTQSVVADPIDPTVTEPTTQFTEATTPTTDNGGEKKPDNTAVIIIVAVVAVAALAGTLVFFIIRKKKQ